MPFRHFRLWHVASCTPKPLSSMQYYEVYEDCRAVCSGINVADDGEDDVRGSNGTLCNLFFALGMLACCRAEGWCSLVLGIQQRDVRPGQVKSYQNEKIKVLWVTFSGSVTCSLALRRTWNSLWSSKFVYSLWTFMQELKPLTERTA